MKRKCASCGKEFENGDKALTFQIEEEFYGEDKDYSMFGYQKIRLCETDTVKFLERMIRDINDGKSTEATDDDQEQLEEDGGGSEQLSTQE